MLVELYKVLGDENISLKSKKRFINRHKKEILKLSIKDFDELYFSINFNNEIRSILFDLYDKYLTDNKLTSLKYYEVKFHNNALKYQNLINNPLVPSVMKKALLDRLFYSNSLPHIINNSKYDEKTRLETCDYLMQDKFIETGIYYNNIIKQYEQINDNKYREYILEKYCKKDSRLVNGMLKHGSEDTRRLIIKRYVNNKNIASIIAKNHTPEVLKDIYLLKEKVLRNYLNNLSGEEAYKILTLSNFPEQEKEQIREKYNFSIKAFLSVQTNEFLKSSIIKQSKDKVIVDYLNTVIDKRLGLILLDKNINYLDWLKIPSLNSNIKEKIIHFKRNQIEEQIKKLSPEQVLFELSNNDKYQHPNLIYKLIIRYKGKELLNQLKNEQPFTICSFTNPNQYSKELIDFIINNIINETNLNIYLNYIQDTNILDTLLEKYNYCFIRIINSLNNDNLLNLNIGFSAYIINKIILNNQTQYILRLNEIPKEKKLEYISSDKYIPDALRKAILMSLGIEEQNVEIINDLTKKENVDVKSLILNYQEIIKFFKLSSLDPTTIIQYGLNNSNYDSWLDILLLIIQNKDQYNFIAIKSFLFMNYYNNDYENNIYIVNNYLELLCNFYKIKDLILYYINNREKLTKEDKSNLKMLLKISVDSIPTTKEELTSFRRNRYLKYKQIIEKTNDIDKLKKIFNILIFNTLNTSLDNIGGLASLKLLSLANPNSKVINSLIEEISLYYKISRLVKTCNNLETLKNTLREIFKTEQTFMDIQNIFLNLDEKIRNLYELEAQINLTRLSKVRNIEGVLNREYMRLYQGEVYDFHDKNYVLYAHVLSENENINDFMQGKANSSRNFLSLSPISYKGQKYYYDLGEMILAFDYLPKGSYICSSTENMGSNYGIMRNSSKTNITDYNERGIVETSAVTNRNSETLVYREGMIPCGIILPGGRKPTEREQQVHLEYNLPYIITQPIKTPIQNVKNVFDINEEYQVETDKDVLEKLTTILTPLNIIVKENEKYTGREIAIFTDSHALLEPTITVLEEIKARGITEIYSLGDNIGSGPNPKEIIDLLEEYNVKSTIGNNECYAYLGTEPFDYLTPERIENEEWTRDELGSSRIKKISLYPASYELLVGNKKISLCHFINDIRWDFSKEHTTWEYQSVHEQGLEPKQFKYTNSREAKRVIEEYQQRKEAMFRGYQDAYKKPILGGKQATQYDAIIQGHVHYYSRDRLKNTGILTLQGTGIGYTNHEDRDYATYYILREKKAGGFDIEEHKVNYNQQYLISNIKSSNLPHKEKILSFLK